MNKSASYIFPLLTIGVLFFVFGFITWVNGVLIPYFQICLQLSNLESSLVAFASYVAYFFMAIPSAWILKKTGYKKGIILGLVIMAAGTIMFLPAAYSRTYAIFLAGLFVTGTGLALLQTAAHPYLAIIGPPESTAQRIGFMGIANKTAGILSQRILGVIFLLNADDIIAAVKNAGDGEKRTILNEYALKIVDPYIVITLVLVALAVLVKFSGLPDVKEKEHEGEHAAENNSSLLSGVVRFPHLVLGVAALFMAAACEVIPIDGVILYGKALGLPLNEARHFPEFTLYLMLAGYLTSTILIPKLCSQQGALRFASILGILLSIGAYLTQGVVSVYMMIAMGFGVAFLWGTIWGLSIQNLGRFTKMGSALMLMSVVGGGIFPLVFGGLIDYNISNPQTAVLMLIPCYAYLFYYSVWGYRMKRWNTSNGAGLPKLKIS